jgi:hypothetical protein
MATSARETQLEERIAQLEDTVAQLIRATFAAVGQLGGNAGFGTRVANDWLTWQRAGATHEDITGLHAHLQRHPAPRKD